MSGHLFSFLILAHLIEKFQYVTAGEETFTTVGEQSGPKLQGSLASSIHFVFSLPILGFAHSWATFWPFTRVDLAHFTVRIGHFNWGRPDTALFWPTFRQAAGLRPASKAKPCCDPKDRYKTNDNPKRKAPLCAVGRRPTKPRRIPKDEG